MQLPEGKHIYFASDFHLGIPNQSASILREKKMSENYSDSDNDSYESINDDYEEIMIKPTEVRY